jgi:hypothetical protein
VRTIEFIAWGEKVSKFQGFEGSRFQGFKVKSKSEVAQVTQVAKTSATEPHLLTAADVGRQKGAG